MSVNTGPTFFISDGIVVTSIDERDEALGVALLPDGRIIVAGHSSDGLTRYNTVVRYTPDGALDTSFGGDGIVTSPLAGATSVASQADGKVLVAGHTAEMFAVQRFNVDGSPDTSFDGDGQVTTAIGSSARANAIVVQSDGRILVAGHADTGTGA